MYGWICMLYGYITLFTLYIPQSNVQCLSHMIEILNIYSAFWGKYLGNRAKNFIQPISLTLTDFGVVPSVFFTIPYTLSLLSINGCIFVVVYIPVCTCFISIHTTEISSCNQQYNFWNLNRNIYEFVENFLRIFVVMQVDWFWYISP